MKKYVVGIFLMCMLMGMIGCGKKNDETTSADSHTAAGKLPIATQAALTWQEQYDLGIRLLNEGNYEEAILAFRAVLTIEPKNTDAYMGIVNAYVQLGDTNQAQAILQEGLLNCGGAYVELFMQTASQHDIQLIIEGILLDEDAQGYDIFESGYLLEKEGKEDVAILLYEISIWKAPWNTMPYFCLADAYISRGETDLAIALLQSGMDRSYTDVEELQKMGLAEWTGEELREALQEYALTIGYVLNDDGILIPLDEEAYLAGLTPEERLRYYFTKGKNRAHWIFEDVLLLDGQSLHELTLDDVIAMSARLGWGEMVNRGSSYAHEVNASTIKGDDVYPFATVGGTADHLEAILVGELYVVNNPEWLSRYTYVDQGFAAAPLVGYCDIRIGDTLEVVLTKLGWDYASEICELLYQWDPAEGYLGYGLQRNAPVWEEGGKQFEDVGISMELYQEVPIIGLHMSIDGGEYGSSSIQMQFDSRDGYRLHSMWIHN